MTAVKTIGLIAVAAAMAVGSSAQAAKRNQGSLAEAYNGPLPPAGFEGRRWSHPNGCDYSLAGRPGERVWYVVINTMGSKDCVRYFVEQALPNDISVTKNLYRYE